MPRIPEIIVQDRFDHLFVQPSSFDASLAFYRDVLGWKLMFSWGDSKEPRGACLSSEAMSIVLAEPHPAADKSKSHGINGTRPTLHLRVDDVDRRYEELSRAKVALFAPEPTHWGTRWFVARDPDGNLIAFEQKKAAKAEITEEDLIWAVHDHVPPEAGRIIDEGLGQSNEAAAPVRDLARLSCFASVAGAIVGGAVGRRWGECCELQQLWVDPAYRRHGVGSKLVRRFEQRAAEHGCRIFYLDTFSFQAPAFYRALGYHAAAEIDGFPHGIVKYLMLRKAKT
jgi:GNAT superfamily N-acetyltransferase